MEIEGIGLEIKKSQLGKLTKHLSPCVVDIGARGGLDEDMLPLAWSTHIIGFEPEADEAARLTEAGDPRWQQVTILPFAVGGTSGPAVLHMPKSEEGASLLRHDSAMAELFGYDNLHVDRREIPVQTVTLDDLHAGGKLPRVDYMKVDIEGAELAVLKSARTVLPDCVALKVECSFLPQRIDQPLIWEVASLLRQEHFAVVGIRDIHVWRRRNLPPHPYRIAFEMPYSRGQLAQCDLILLRTPESVGTTDQALRLVVLSAVLGYFDYAVTVMRIKPDLQQHVSDTFGVDLERELKRWSKARGREEVSKAIRASLRGLVPLTRSLINKLPYVVPTRPF